MNLKNLHSLSSYKGGKTDSQIDARGQSDCLMAPAATRWQRHYLHLLYLLNNKKPNKRS